MIVKKKKLIYRLHGILYWNSMRNSILKQSIEFPCYWQLTHMEAKWTHYVTCFFNLCRPRCRSGKSSGSSDHQIFRSTSDPPRPIVIGLDASCVCTHFSRHALLAYSALLRKQAWSDSWRISAFLSCLSHFRSRFWRGKRGCIFTRPRRLFLTDCLVDDARAHPFCSSSYISIRVPFPFLT